MIGREAVDVLRTLVADDLGLPPDHLLQFVLHEVGLNWRQRNVSARQRIEALDSSLLNGPVEPFLLRADDDASLSELLGTARDRGLALSVTSRVLDRDRRFAGHLALMNLHPEGFSGPPELADAIRRVTGGMPGYLLDSGRFFHFYGIGLLGAREWIEFVARFLMPCTTVSPRYVGHSLSRGFCCLRLTPAPPHKPRTPAVVFVLRPPRPAG